jgi:hypothetical protein
VELQQASTHFFAGWDTALFWGLGGMEPMSVSLNFVPVLIIVALVRGAVGNPIRS